MPALRELQQRFIDGLLSEDDSLVLPFIAQPGPAAAQRFDIYRNNCGSGFLAALAAGYPVLQRLTGTAYFRQLARDFQLAHPSPSGNLQHAGQKLPDYLERRFAGTPYGYFSHVARIEWACQEVLAAPDHASLDLERLARVSPADYPHLCFALDPALRLVASPYPVVRIWEAHQHHEDPGPMDISTGGEQALVRREDSGVCIHRLSPAEFACLAAFRDARSLEHAVGEALRLEPGMDLPGALRRWAGRGFIVDFFVIGASMAD